MEPITSNAGEDDLLRRHECITSSPPSTRGSLKSFQSMKSKPNKHDISKRTPEISICFDARQLSSREGIPLSGPKTKVHIQYTTQAPEGTAKDLDDKVIQPAAEVFNETYPFWEGEMCKTSIEAHTEHLTHMILEEAAAKGKDITVRTMEDAQITNSKWRSTDQVPGEMHCECPAHLADTSDRLTKYMKQHDVLLATRYSRSGKSATAPYINTQAIPWYKQWSHKEKIQTEIGDALIRHAHRHNDKFEKFHHSEQGWPEWIEKTQKGPVISGKGVSIQTVPYDDKSGSGLSGQDIYLSKMYREYVPGRESREPELSTVDFFNTDDRLLYTRLGRASESEGMSRTEVGQNGSSGYGHHGKGKGRALLGRAMYK